jgi:hypothetical protein
MALPVNYPNSEVCLAEGTTSIATTPIAATVVSPVSGYIKRVCMAAGGTFTGTVTTTVVVNGGSDICGGTFTLAAQTGAVAGVSQDLNLVGAGTTSGVHVNPGDVIVFTPSGGTGSTIQGAFALVIRKDN